MGLWNATCGISHLPILGGEPCRLLFLVEAIRQERGDGGLTGTEELWKPFSLPIPGTYDESGGLDNPEPDWYIEVFVNQVKELLVEQEPRHEHDEPVSKNDLDLDAILRHVYNGRLALDAGEQGVLHLGLIFIREDVYEALAAGPLIDGNKYIELEIVQKQEMERLAHEKTVNSLIKRAGALGMVAKAAEKQAGDQEDVEEESSTLLDTAKETLESLQNYKKLIAGVQDGTPAFEPVRTALAKRMEDGLPDEDISVRWGIHETAKLRLVRWHMQALRRSWMPQPGNGSQSCGWMSNQVLLDVMRSVVEPALEKEHGGEFIDLE